MEFESNQIKRKVFRVFVFGRKGVGKSTLLRRIARPTFDTRLQTPNDTVIELNTMGNEIHHQGKVATARRLVQNEETKDTLLVFTEWPHSAIADWKQVEVSVTCSTRLRTVRRWSLRCCVINI